jgi:short-subunit dehydrogenase
MASHKIVVITGASAGVGRATVREFAQNGYWVGLLARGSAGLEGARAEVEALGGRALIVPADVADHAQVDAAAIAVESTLGPIDVWVNNAMVSVFSPVDEMSPEEFKRVTEVTYLGVVYGTMAALRFMRGRSRGTIIQVGSALAYRSIPLQSAYCGAKHAIRGFTDGLRSELIHDNINIHLSMVQLPALNTPQFDWVKSRLPGKAQPVPPIFEPEVAARAIYWAAHHRRREVYVGMPTVKAIIANKIIPGYLDRYLASHGYDAQQTEEPADPNAPTNLWNPLPGDHGAHGRFGRRAQSGSLQLWFTTHRRLVATLAAAAGAAGFAYTMRRWNSTRWLSDLVRTAWRRPSKSPVQVTPFASSRPTIPSVADHVRQS